LIRALDQLSSIFLKKNPKRLFATTASSTSLTVTKMMNLLLMKYSACSSKVTRTAITNSIPRRCSGGLLLVSRESARVTKTGSTDRWVK